MLYNFAYRGSKAGTKTVQAGNLHNACDKIMVFISQQRKQVVIDSEVLIHNNDGRFIGTESLLDIEHEILEYI